MRSSTRKTEHKVLWKHPETGKQMVSWVAARSAADAVRRLREETGAEEVRYGGREA